MLDKLLKVLLFLFIALFFVFCLSWYFLACSSSQPERIYYPVVSDAFTVVELVDVDAGQPYECPDDAETFAPIRHVKPDSGLPSGILISECQFAKENISGTSQLKKLKRQTKVIKKVARQQQKVIDETEKAYQDKIFDLEEKAKRSWWEENKVYLGVAFGVMASVLVFFIVDTVEDLDEKKQTELEQTP